MDEFLVLLNAHERCGHSLTVEVRTMKAGDPSSRQTLLTVFPSPRVELRYIFNQHRALVTTWAEPIEGEPHR